MTEFSASFPIRRPYLVFLGDVQSEPFAKTAFGVRDWRPDQVIGQWRLPDCRVDLGAAEMTPREAAELGAGSLLLGVAPIGGAIPPAWIGPILEAIEAGLDIVSGQHTRLSDMPEIRHAAETAGVRLHDVRHPRRTFPIATGRKRSGKRLLMVGTDCSVGKKYTALALADGLKSRGLPADFRATGQTGVIIAGEGVVIDAVVADFIAGAAETLSPDAAPDHWDVIEGQGSLFHPAYAGVTLGLLHGSQPDAFVLCHDPSRTTVNGYPDVPLTPLDEAVRRYVEAGRLTNPAIACVGVALNTSKMPLDEAEALARAVEAELGVPVADPLRFGLERIVDKVAAL